VQFGDPSSMGILAEPREVAGAWTFGVFLFLFGGVVIGDAADAADLKGCCRWSRAYLGRPKATPIALSEVPAAHFFEHLDRHRSQEMIDQFGISHLGMSSFDRVELFLLPRSGGGDRIFWRKAPGEAGHHDLAEDVFRSVLESCVLWMECHIE